jgi:hypothetical protein
VKRCEWITSPQIGIYRPGKKVAGGQCSRTATYTNGVFSYCTQHAKEPATVLHRASGRIQEGFHPITKKESDVDLSQA